MTAFPFKRSQLLIAANVLVALFALAWVIRTLWAEDQMIPESPADPLGNVELRVPLIETSAVKAHPLFVQNRLPVSEKSGLDDQDAVKNQLPPLIVGIFKSSHGELGAIMEDAQTGVRKFVRGGGEFLGWKLAAVRPKTAVLSQGGQEIEVPLSFGSRTTLATHVPEPTNKAP